MATYADAGDIADRLGRDLDEYEQRIVEARLQDVEALIETRLPDLAERITNNTLNVHLVTMVEADVILRMIRNPEGLTQETDGNYSYSIDSSVASGRMSLLPEEWRMLGLRNSVGVLRPIIRIPGAGTVRPNPNADFEPDLDTAVWA